ncbi:MAG: hypothetical protein LCH38_10960 [Proteobacteria bacterium]|nr:hypothetical protein [Pseudomonadota bacterium]
MSLRQPRISPAAAFAVRAGLAAALLVAALAGLLARDDAAHRACAEVHTPATCIHILRG